MKKLLTALAVSIAFSAPAQTLFTYGKKTVSATEFLQAFQKANSGQATNQSVKEYLDLYIASRLKIEEAKALGYDTLPQLAADLANLRQQIMPAYLTDKESINQMINEAFSRSQKDLQLAHIFIKTGDNLSDVEEKKAQVVKALKTKDFAAVASEFSDDPSAKTNGGELGWITVFSLPYELENLAYNTSTGKVSAPYQSKAGYHFIKVLSSRKALGRVKASQMLLALPPNATEAAKADLKVKADSLYQRLKDGDDFGKLAAAFSQDLVSASSGGQMSEFGVGEYDPLFETTVLQLKDGDISQPFFTTHGYHIVKRQNVKPVADKLTDEEKEAFRQRIQQSDRSQVAQATLAANVQKKAGYQKLSFSDAELQAYTDSIFSYQAPNMRITLQPSTALMQIGKEKATVADWMTFAQGARMKKDGSGPKPFAQVWNEFVQATALNYYQDYLEDFNEDFRRQIAEFAEGNLFFEIMQHQVWTPAQTDSAALAAYFQQHKQEYNWKESADAVVFYAPTQEAAAEFYTALRQNPSGWQALLPNFSEKITADSNRFEWDGLPVENKQSIKEGSLTTPVVNKTDSTVSFAYVLRLYSKPEARSYADAKGLVINDYQAQLEKEWVNNLKKKYPITINQKVWKEVVAKATR